jgi:hypothetical protein
MAALALLVTSTVFTLVPSNLFCKISKEGRSNAKFLTDWSEDAPQSYEGAGRAIDSVNAMQALTIDVNASINGIMNELQTIDLVLEKRVNPPLLTLKLGLQTKNTKLKIDQFIESHARDWTDWAKLGGIAAFQIGLDVVPLVKNVVKLQIEQYKFNKAAGPKAKVLKNKLIGKGSVWKRARATRLSKFGKFVKGANVIAAVVLAAVKVLDIIETCKKYKNAANDARQNKAELFAEWEEAKQSMKTVLGFVEQERKFFV